jgi:uncharacterized protein DUF5818
MKRIPFASALIGLVVLVPAAYSQGLQPSPEVSPLDPGTQLIGWTAMQEPHPVPQPDPHPRPLPDPQPEQQKDRQNPDDQANQPAPSPRQDQQTNEVFTGTIVKAGETYVLKSTGDTTYNLDDQEKARPFEGKRVKISGKLASSSKTIQIGSIEPLG